MTDSTALAASIGRTMTLACKRASLAAITLGLAMHARGCSDCGYGARRCPRTILARQDKERLNREVALWLD